MPRGVAFTKLQRDPHNQQIWTCPHCHNRYGLRKSFYYNVHFKGRHCLQQPQQQQHQVDRDRSDAADQQQVEEEGFDDPLDDWDFPPDAEQLQEYVVDQQLVSFGLNAGQQFGVLQLLEAQRQSAQLPRAGLQQQHSDAGDGLQHGQQQQEGDDTNWVASEQGEFVRHARQRAEELRRLRDQPLFEGAQCCALEAHLLLFNWFCKYAIKHRAFEALLTLLALILPADNLLSKSLYLFRKVMGAKDPSQYMYFACPNNKCWLGPYPKEAWGKAPIKRCNCKTAEDDLGLPFFVEVPVTNGRTDWEPAGRTFYLLDVCEAVQDLYLLPDFSAAVGTWRPYNRIGTWHASPAHRDLDNRLKAMYSPSKCFPGKGPLYDLFNSIYDLGMDGVQLLVSRKHNTILFYLRPRDLPPHLVGKHRYCRLVMVIEGPTQPDCLDAFLDALGRQLRRLSDGIYVQTTVLDQLGRVVPDKVIFHHGFVANLFGDAPMRAKVLYFVGGFTAFLVCVYCRLCGKTKGSTRRYLGYSQPVQAVRGVGVGKSFQMGRQHDAARHFTSGDMIMLAQRAQQDRDAGRPPADYNPFRGISPLLVHLPYLDIQTAAVIPFMHAFFQGVVKDFLKAIFAKKGMAGSVLPAKRQGAAAAAANAVKRARADKAQQQQQKKQVASARAQPASRQQGALTSQQQQGRRQAGILPVTAAAQKDATAKQGMAGSALPRQHRAAAAAAAAAGAGKRSQGSKTKRQQLAAAAIAVSTSAVAAAAGANQGSGGSAQQQQAGCGALSQPEGRGQGALAGRQQQQQGQVGNRQQAGPTGSRRMGQQQQRHPPQPGTGVGAPLQPVAQRATSGGDINSEQQHEPSGEDTCSIPESKQVPPKMRHAISNRVSGYRYHMHPDRGRPVRDPVKDHGGLHFSDLADGLTLFAPLFWPISKDGTLFHVIPDQSVREGWGLLREIGRFNMQPQEFTSQEEFMEAVYQMHDRLIKYGQLVEQDFTPGKDPDDCSSSLARSNLHGLACQLHMQILHMGLTCFLLEYWLEREMGCTKARTRGKITAQPSHVVVAMELDNRAQHEAALALGIVLQESEEDGHVIVPSRGNSSSRLRTFVQAAALVDKYRMAGACRPMEDDLWQAVQGYLKAHLQQHGTWPLWEGVWHDQQHRTLVYQVAYIPGNTRVMSREYQRSKTRNGTRVQVNFADSSGVMHPFACEVLRLIELQPMSSAATGGTSSSFINSRAAAAEQHGNLSGGTELSVMVRQYNTVARTDQPELADVLLEAKVDDFHPQPFLVDLTDIICALNACEVSREGVRWLQFPPHHSMSTGYVCDLPSTVYNTY